MCSLSSTEKEVDQKVRSSVPSCLFGYPMSAGCSSHLFYFSKGVTSILRATIICSRGAKFREQTTNIAEERRLRKKGRDDGPLSVRPPEQQQQRRLLARSRSLSFNNDVRVPTSQKLGWGLLEGRRLYLFIVISTHLEGPSLESCRELHCITEI